jgi:gamma-glutamylcyclotransferase (GGCT)/AIG2-like uncharacterized protein YtfP
MRTSRSVAVATLATALGITLAGCGAGEGPDTGPTANPTTATAESSPSPTGPTVPDGWKAASAEIAQLHVPPAWKLDSYADQAQTMIAPKNKVGLSPGSGEIMADVYSTDGKVEAALDELAGLRGKALKKDTSFTALKQLPNETINGSLFYHFRAETKFTWEDHYGTLVPDAGMQVTVVWSFNKSDIDRQGAEALSAPIMATYETL